MPWKISAFVAVFVFGSQFSREQRREASGSEEISEAFFRELKKPLFWMKLSYREFSLDNSR
jgi:hypothetical protein